jgi:hypothetical protein
MAAMAHPGNTGMMTSPGSPSSGHPVDQIFREVRRRTGVTPPVLDTEDVLKLAAHRLW